MSAAEFKPAEQCENCRNLDEDGGTCKTGSVLRCYFVKQPVSWDCWVKASKPPLIDFKPRVYCPLCSRRIDTKEPDHIVCGACATQRKVNA